MCFWRVLPFQQGLFGGKIISPQHRLDPGPQDGSALSPFQSFQSLGKVTVVETRLIIHISGIKQLGQQLTTC